MFYHNWTFYRWELCSSSFNCETLKFVMEKKNEGKPSMLISISLFAVLSGFCWLNSMTVYYEAYARWKTVRADSKTMRIWFDVYGPPLRDFLDYWILNDLRIVINSHRKAFMKARFIHFNIKYTIYYWIRRDILAAWPWANCQGGKREEDVANSYGKCSRLCEGWCLHSQRRALAFVSHWKDRHSWNQSFM